MTLFEMMLTPDFFFAILRITAPVLFATMGAVVGEKAGVSNIGLFGRVESATVKDLGIENGTVFGLFLLFKCHFLTVFV